MRVTYYKLVSKVKDRAPNTHDWSTIFFGPWGALKIL